MAPSVWAPPDAFADAIISAFVIDADRKAIQTLADNLLNPAGKGTLRYESVLPIAMLSFLDSARSTSLADRLGWVPGRECAIWVPLVERRPGSAFGARVVFWSPYIFVTYAIGLVTGREVWGWPKPPRVSASRPIPRAMTSSSAPRPSSGRSTLTPRARTPCSIAWCARRGPGVSLVLEERGRGRRRTGDELFRRRDERPAARVTAAADFALRRAQAVPRGF